VRRERHPLHDRDAGDAGNTRDATRRLFVHTVSLGARLRTAEVQLDVQEPRRRESEVLRLHAPQALHEEAGPDHQHERERDLEREQNVLEQETPRRAVTAAGA